MPSGRRALLNHFILLFKGFRLLRLLRPLDALHPPVAVLQVLAGPRSLSHLRCALLLAHPGRGSRRRRRPRLRCLPVHCLDPVGHFIGDPLCLQVGPVGQELDPWVLQGN